MGLLTSWTPEGGMQEVPTYTCAHCNAVVLMNPQRRRERRRCMKCLGTLCEKNLICIQDCTPLREIAKDHFEGDAARRWGKFVPAIMAGCTSPDEAEEKGLIIG